MSDFVISQILVGGAIVLDMISFQMKKREHVLCCFFLAVGLISTHFWLLDQYTASTLMAVAAVRYFISIFSTSPIFRYIFLTASVISTILTYSSWTNLLALTATVFNTIGAFTKNDKEMRLLFFGGIPLWIVHNIIVGSPLAAIMDSLLLSSNVLGYYRLYIRKTTYKK